MRGQGRHSFLYAFDPGIEDSLTVAQVWGSHSGDGSVSAVAKSGSDKEEAERPQNGKTES